LSEPEELSDDQAGLADDAHLIRTVRLPAAKLLAATIREAAAPAVLRRIAFINDFRKVMGRRRPAKCGHRGNRVPAAKPDIGRSESSGGR
jgi:hypothetical protein